MFATESSHQDYTFKPIDFVSGCDNTIIRTPSPIKISSAPVSPAQPIESLDGMKHGIVQKYSEEPESFMSLIEESTYTYGVLHGPYKRWFSNSAICEDSIYDNNKLVVQKYYYISGQISAEYNYADGKKHGLQKMWHPNGKLSFTGQFNKGITIGQHIHYNNKGNKIILQTYNDEGKLHGVCQKWREDDGQLVEDWGFINDKPHGMNFTYYKTCVLSILFDHGNAIQCAELPQASKDVEDTTLNVNPRPTKRVRFDSSCKQ